MDKIEKSGQYLFAFPWIVFGIQHFMYSEFVKSLVPAYMPLQLFWVYFTGIGMVAAGISLIINVKPKLAAACLALMLFLFVLQLHVPLVAGDVTNSQNWTRALQDVSIAAIACIITGQIKLVVIARYLYAVPIIIFGVQHFLNLKFVVVPVPDFMPVKIVWGYLLGTIMISGGLSIITGKFLKVACLTMGVALLMFIVLHLPALFTDIKNAIKWVTIMLELTIASGAFILVGKEKENSVSAGSIFNNK